MATYDNKKQLKMVELNKYLTYQSRKSCRNLELSHYPLPLKPLTLQSSNSQSLNQEPLSQTFCDDQTGLDNPDNHSFLCSVHLENKRQEKYRPETSTRPQTLMERFSLETAFARSMSCGDRNMSSSASRNVHQTSIITESPVSGGTQHSSKLEDDESPGLGILNSSARKDIDALDSFEDGKKREQLQTSVRRHISGPDSSYMFRNAFTNEKTGSGSTVTHSARSQSRLEGGHSAKLLSSSQSSEQDDSVESSRRTYSCSSDSTNRLERNAERLSPSRNRNPDGISFTHVTDNSKLNENSTVHLSSLQQSILKKPRPQSEFYTETGNGFASYHSSTAASRCCLQQSSGYEEHNIICVGESMSLCMPEERLFLSLALPSLYPHRKGCTRHSGRDLSKQHISSTSPFNSFSVGLLNYYLTPGCEHSEKMFYEASTLLTVETEKEHKLLPSSKELNMAPNLYMVSSQQIFLLPIFWLFHTCFKQFLQKWKLSMFDTTPTEPIHPNLIEFVDFYRDSLSFTVQADAPCLVCLPVGLSGQNLSPTSVSLHWKSSLQLDPLPNLNHLETGLIVCVLRKRSKAPCMSCTCSDVARDAVSKELEFRPTCLDALILQYAKEIQQNSLDFSEMSILESHPQKDMKRPKRDVFYHSLMLQTIRKNSILHDAIWVFEHATERHPHNLVQTAENLRPSCAKYFLRNFLDEYLVVERDCVSSSKYSTTQAPDFFIGHPVLRHLTDPVSSPYLTQWMINHKMLSMLLLFNMSCALQSFRPMEPQWFLETLHFLQSPLPADWSQAKHLFKTSNTLNDPFKSVRYSLPVAVQETLFVEDFFLCFLGISGLFVQFRYTKDELCHSTAVGSAVLKKLKAFDFHQDWLNSDEAILLSTSESPIENFFYIQESLGENDSIQLDPSLIEMTKRILCILRSYRKICRFIEVQGDRRFGLCNQGLVDGMKQSLVEFQEHLLYMESLHQQDSLSLQKFWLLIQPAASLFHTLENIIDAVRGRRGGALVNALLSVYQSLSRVDSVRSLCCTLLSKAAAPLVTILGNWICKGVIRDPHDEFWIKNDLSISPNSSDILCVNQQSGSLLDNMFKPLSSETIWAPKLLPCMLGGHPYWYLKFQARESHHIPCNLLSIEEHILQAGKHTNILMTCLNNVCSTDVSPQQHWNDIEPTRFDTTASFVESNFSQIVLDTCQVASNNLLKYFFNCCDLKTRFLSISRFMFFSRSDMISSLLCSIEKELKMYRLSEIFARMDLIFESALSSSTLYDDFHRDMFFGTLSYLNTREIASLLNAATKDEFSLHNDNTPEVMLRASGVRFSCSDSYNVYKSHPLLQTSHALNCDPTTYSLSLNAISSSTQTTNIQKYQDFFKYFTLSFECYWPLSLIFTKATILKYQLLSRLVLQLKFTEKKLTEIWQSQMRCGSHAERFNQAETVYLSYMLRLRMLHFVRNITFYILIEVLEPRFHQFLENLMSSRSLNEIIQLHNTFLDTCLNETLLNEPNALRCLSKTLTVCHLYTSTVIKYSLYRMETSHITPVKVLYTLASKGKEKTSYNGIKKEPVANTTGTISEEQFGALVKQYNVHFERNLKQFLVLLVEAQHSTQSPLECRYSTAYMHNLLTRLDFNGYYSKLYNFTSSITGTDKTHFN